jgi:hypothetical protein
MMDILSSSASIFSDAGFTTHRATVGDREVLIFEDTTVLGFLLVYDDATRLLATFETDAEQLIRQNQFALRRAGQKAWNAYMVFLASGSVNYSQSPALVAIEEDLTGTRKIARAGVRDSEDLRNALLALLPIQAAPTLDAVDMHTEIRERASELPSRAIDAFLSAKTEESVVLQVLEEEP